MHCSNGSFYLPLRSRLATVDPARTITLDGAVRPAVYVVENEVVLAASPPSEAFAIFFGAARVVETSGGTRRPLLALDCDISYQTAGSNASLNTDRGRTLAALDLELLQICSPPYAAKQNFTVTPTVSLGTQILWQRPDLGAIEVAGNQLRRTAKTTLFFYPEVDF